MFEQIEKLKQTKTKLKTDFEDHRTEYKTEVKRIDRAIKNFEKGIGELSGSADKPKRYKSTSVIEEILMEAGPMHLKQLCEKLHERGIPMHYQSLSGLLQSYAKAGKKFVKTAPATFGLIPIETSNLESTEKEAADFSNQTIVYDQEAARIISED